MTRQRLEATAAILGCAALAVIFCVWIFLRYTECRAFGFSVLYCIGR